VERTAGNRMGDHASSRPLKPRHVEGGTVSTASDELVVHFKSEVLGAGEFWRGPPSRIHEIRNVVARELAAHVAEDGRRRQDGMWIVHLERHL
jgi:hypothetical protein